jgi:acyl dehydratase
MTVEPEPRVIGPLAQPDFVRYSGASGDFNPMHFDESQARAAGFDSVFAQGMFTAGLLGSYAADCFGPTALRRFQVRFVSVVWPGDVVTCSATVEREYDDDGERRVEVALRATRQTGDVAVQGSAVFAVDPAQGHT